VSVTLAVALASLFVAQELDGIATARIETTTGTVPFTSGDGLVTTLEILPTGTALVTGHTAQFNLSYTPRIYFRTGSSIGRPLLLHRVSLGYRQSFDRAWFFDGSVAGSYGELDFSRAVEIFGADQPPPADSIVKFASLSGALVLTRDLSLGDSIELAIRPSYTKPEAGGVTFLEQLRTVGTLQYSSTLSARDVAVGTVGFESSEYLGDGALAGSVNILEASGRLEHSFTRAFSAYGLVGVAAGLGDDVELLPLGEAGITADLFRSRAFTFGTVFSAGVDANANPLTTAFEGRLVTSLTLTMSIGRDLEIRPSGSLFTPITALPEGLMISGLSSLETVVSARFPVTYRFNDDLTLEFGGRGSARGPRFSAENFELSQLELVAYVSLTGTLDSRIPELSR
jgi:hypothetical protein